MRLPFLAHGEEAVAILDDPARCYFAHRGRPIMTGGADDSASRETDNYRNTGMIIEERRSPGTVVRPSRPSAYTNGVRHRAESGKATCGVARSQRRTGRSNRAVESFIRRGSQRALHKVADCCASERRDQPPGTMISGKISSNRAEVNAGANCFENRQFGRALGATDPDDWSLARLTLREPYGSVRRSFPGIFPC